jgi:type IV secretion system protein VirD4
MTPDEVRNLPAPAELLFLVGQRPVVARKLAYYEDPEFKGMFD